MALPSSMTYGSLMSGANAPQPNLISGGVHQLQPYSQPVDQIRTQNPTPSVNPYGQGADLTSRINSLSNSYYTQLQARANANNTYLQNAYSQQAAQGANFRTDPATARSIFQGAYDSGLVGSNPYQNEGWHVGMTTQDNPNSLESQYAAYNRGIFGAVNKANLMNYGVDPNAVSQAYQHFLTSSATGRS